MAASREIPLEYTTVGGMTNQTADLKRSLEGPQICTMAKQLAPEIITGKDFVAVKEHFYIVGYFDSIDEMNEVYDKYAGHVGLEADANGWKLLKPPR
jgi:hypothetical protein